MNIIEPKHDFEMEQAILGALLIDKDIVPYTIGILSKEDFYDDRNKYVYDSILQLSKEGIPIDMISVKSRLESMEQKIKLGGKEVVDKYKRLNLLGNVGGMLYLSELTEIVPTTANYITYIKKLKECTILRKYNTLSHRIHSSLENNVDSEQLGKTLEKELMNINSISTSDETEKLDIVLTNHFESLYDSIQEGEGDIKSIKTGYPDLDAILGSMYGGDLVVIGASSGIGKTMLGLNITNNVILRDQKTLLFTMEMNKATIMNRFLSMNTDTKLFTLTKWRDKLDELNYKLIKAKDRLESGEDKDDLFVRSIEKAINEARDRKEEKAGEMMNQIGDIAEKNFYINDKSGITTDVIRKKIMELSITEPVDLVVIDQLSLMKGEGKGIRERYDIITGELKNIARDYNCVVLLMVQLSTKVIGAKQDHVPELQDIKESSKIYEDADKVLMLERPQFWTSQNGEVDEFTDPTMHIYVRKNRGGAMGKLNLSCDLTHQKLTNLSQVDKSLISF